MFPFAHAGAPSWRECVAACAQQLGRPGRGLGFVYFTDALVEFSSQILEELRQRTGVEQWVGSVGLGVLATGVEYQEQPAMVAMVADISGFSVFSGRSPLKNKQSNFAVVHADPAAPDVAGLIADLSAKVASGFLVGGLSSSRSRTVQIANAVLSGGLSGAALAPEVAVATRLTQGCVPFPGRYRVTECEENIIATLDGRPATRIRTDAVGISRFTVQTSWPTRSWPIRSWPGSPGARNLRLNLRVTTSLAYWNPSRVVPGGIAVARFP